MSRRTERVASLIRRIVAEQIQDGLHDPRVPSLTSVTRVDVAPDFSVADVHVSVMSAGPGAELCVAALRHAAGRIQSILAPQLTMRVCPRLRFHLDESLKRGFALTQLIDHEMAELRAREAARAQADGSRTEQAEEAE
ncbi:MAG: Ribosome-binding factor A [Phycisphaerae bacterium]|nr:Ribosome-binding factor A [Phycisphaerae bacterium]